MDAGEVERFRILLAKRRDSAMEVVKSGEEAAGAVELDQARVGRLSRMDALQAQAMAVETDRRRKVEVRRIDAALQRIEDADYGDCFDCGEPIATARLEIDPAATLCIQCAGKAEG